MAEDPILKRLDGHLARGNELMAEVRHHMELTEAAHNRNTAAHDRNTVAFEGVMDTVADVRREFEKNREFYADVRQFTRDITRRNELVVTQLIEESRANAREILARLPPAA